MLRQISTIDDRAEVITVERRPAGAPDGARPWCHRRQQLFDRHGLQALRLVASKAELFKHGFSRRVRPFAGRDPDGRPALDNGSLDAQKILPRR
jgi:hypothetical protein